MTKPGLFRIFLNRKYALYFSGQFISQTGTWMQQVALSWFTYNVTKSPFLLTAVAASSQLPSLVLMPFAGVAADRFNRHRILLATQILGLIQAATLAYVALTPTVQIWQLLALGLFAGLVNAFDMPTRSAFVVDLIDKKEDLPDVMAMNVSLMNIPRLIGPALAGIIVAAKGETMCFLVNSISYVAVIVALLFIKGDFKPKKRKAQSIVQELKDGLIYVVHTDPIRSLILLLAAFSLVGISYMVLLPVFVKQIGGNANTLGYMMSSSALGSLLGALLLTYRKNVHQLAIWVMLSAFSFSLGLIGLSFVNSFWPAILVMWFIGASMMLLMAATMTILQTVVEEDKRGRVISLFTTALLGGVPIGGLIAGAISSRFGYNTTILGCGICSFLVALVFAVHMSRTDFQRKTIQKALLPIDEEPGLLVG